jgi:hypothetical protein
MKNALIELSTADSRRTTMAHYRIAQFICDIVSDSAILNKESHYQDLWNSTIQNIVVVYASRFSEAVSFKQLESFFNKHSKSKIFWLANEYNLAPNSTIARIFKERGVHVIANFVEEACQFKKFNEFTMINFNVSAYRMNAKIVEAKDRKYDLIYYGTFRPDRQNYFSKYLSNAVVSTSKKNIYKFKKAIQSSETRYIDKLDWQHGNCFIRQFRFSLYIEDNFTHSNFNNLSDRFYECLSYDVPMIFDSSCIKTIKQSGYAIPSELIVGSRQELKELLQHYRSIENYNEILSKWNELKLTFQSEIQSVKSKLLHLLG